MSPSDLEGLPGLPCHPASRAGAAQGRRGPVLLLLRQGAERHPEAARALEARRGPDQPGPRRSGGQGLCRSLLPRRGEGPGPGDGRQHPRRLPHPHRTAWTGCRRRPRPRPWPSSPPSRWAWAIRTAGRTTGPQDPGRRRLRQRRAGRALRVHPEPAQARAAHRPLGMGDDAADRERREPARHERPQLPGRHPAASLLRSEAPHGHGLRRHRRRDRPRDQPQLRRFGVALSTPAASSTTGGRRRI